MRIYIIFLIFSLILTPNISSSNLEMEVISTELNDIDILVIISDDCGWNYFIVNETLHEMGVNVITLTNTESYTVSSCPNKEPRPITADLLLSEFDLESIDEYKGVLLPGGGQWRYLSNDSDVHELLEVAHENGLVVASICNGALALERSDVVTNGTKIVNPLPSVYRMLKDRGVIIVSRAQVVSDNRIITGIGGGPEDAPTYDVCIEMVKTITGNSYVADTKVMLNNETSDLDYLINVEISNLAQEFPDFNILNVQEVIAYIFPEDNSSNITEIELSYIQGTSYYSGNFTIPTTGKFVVNLDIINEGYGFEVVRNATTFIVEEPVDDLQLMTLLVLGGGLGVVVVVIILVFWKRKV